MWWAIGVKSTHEWLTWKQIVEQTVLEQFVLPRYTETGWNTLKDHFELVQRVLKETNEQEHQFQLGFDRRKLRHLNDPYVTDLGYCFNPILAVCYLLFIVFYFFIVFH